jgi:hypothetical protein
MFNPTIGMLLYSKNGVFTQDRSSLREACKLHHQWHEHRAMVWHTRSYSRVSLQRGHQMWVCGYSCEHQLQMVVSARP